MVLVPAASSASSLQVHRLLAAALAPGLTHEQWREACEEDWASDLRGGDPKEGLTLEGLVISLFEVRCDRRRAERKLR